MENYQWMQDQFLLTPYLLDDAGAYKSEVLVSIYDRLKREDLYGVVFHDNPEMGLFGFMNFFNSPGVLLQIINRIEGGEIVDVAAMCWLVGLERFVDKQKGVASFVVFRDYQKPHFTSTLASLAVGYWFKELKMDIVIGMTPSLNRPAVRFIKRIGFEEMFRIPGYTSLRGVICDSVVSIFNREKYFNIY